jgi:RNA polymerase sigma-70 factor, ECF subfamily
VADLAERLPDSNGHDMFDDLEASLLKEQLWRLVDTLPPSQADLIRRAYVSGQTHFEIAAATGIPLGTVKSRIRLGLEKLRCAMLTEHLASMN